MKITPNPQLKREALDLLRTEYGMNVRRPGVHQSELAHCLTLSYWDRVDPEPLSDRECMLFAIGFAQERVMLRGGEPSPPEIVVDGISLSLDSINLLSSPLDLKTTRMRAGGRKGEGGFQFPDGWKKQFAAYLYGLNAIQPERTGNELWAQSENFLPEERLSFGVVVMHLVEPELSAWTIEYTHNELVEHWSWLLTRHSQLDSMLAAGNPMPFTHNEEWECGIGTPNQCRYAYKCQLWKSIETKEFG